MFITKSLFKEFTDTPKLAWYHINDKKTYQNIQEDIYGGMDGEAIGQSVEDMVKKLYNEKSIVEIDTTNLDYKNRHKSYHEKSNKAFFQKPDVLYQAGFVVDNFFAKTDFLVKNETGKYDLMEVKSKNTIRADNKDQNLIDELMTDVSFQKYVLEKSMGDLFSGNCYIVHLNKEFKKHGEIDPSEILVQELVNNDLMTNDAIEGILKTIESDLSLGLDDFNKKYPYDGGDYFTYFGEHSPKKSIWNIAGIDKKKKKALYESGKILIDDVTDEDILTILANKDGGDSKSSKFMNLWKQGDFVINKEEIKQRLSSLTFPLFFYDYETICFPIPVLDGLGPRGQTVVQYSVHKIYQDGTITHKDCIIHPGETNNKRIIDSVIRDLEGGNGTYIVWNKAFECGRNKESGMLYHEHEKAFETINKNTFDLMTIFSDQLYFDRRFLGSASIKKVLPVLTDISYDDLDVGNGGVAMNLLYEIQQGNIKGSDLDQSIKNLLTYCEQDTRAMVRIWEVVKEKIQ
ncbi:MAG: DUF2779 domain-containing protein [Candidatus Absconditabacteria bacterium]